MNGRQGCAGLLLAALSLPVLALGAPEQEELRLGFIKLTDMAPLAVAYERAISRMRDSTSPSKPRRTGRSCWIG
jgi:hypothetical protein